MVIEYEDFTSLNQNSNLHKNKEFGLYENMDKIRYNTEINKIEEDGKTTFKEYLEDSKSSNELLRVSNNSNFWWSNDNEDEKLDSRQRWSFGSDISIEASQNIQNRLCCSPVDEFESTVSSENEELIVNGTDERDESYKNYVQVSPACSPTFEKVGSGSDNKKQNKNQDVDTADDELIDYSKRYTTDSSMSIVENKHINSSHVQQRQQRNIVVNTITRCVPEKKSAVNKMDPYGDYPETDLDQPTNYSLRYAEEDTDEEEKQDPQFYCTGEQEDTVKTYYTEGTPYQTPCNFSTATSMSDLLSLEDNRDGDEAIYKRQFLKEQRQETTEKSDKAIKDSRNRIRKKYISKDSKFSVLGETREIDDQKVCERKLEKLCTPPQSPAEPFDKEKENKAVTFNVEENYAQETPLMFSRSSSLDSLSEFEQNSIHDDHSSIISDFSHRTSGVVSPSELPDSPTQIVPTNTRLKEQNFHHQQEQLQRIPLRPNTRKSLVQNNKGDKEIQLAESLSHNCESTFKKSKRVMECGSVFEDGLVTFKEESMPNKMHSTMASSLSSLTIDEDEDNGIANCNNQQIINKIAAIRVRTSAAGMHQAPMQKQYFNNTFSETDKMLCQPQIHEVLNKHSGYRSDCLRASPNKEDDSFVNVEEDNNRYMAYVNNDTQNNIYRDPLKYPWYDEEIKNNNRNHSNSCLSSPISKPDIKIDSVQRLDVEDVTDMDTIRVYCTEDTPTFISPFGSQSNLSALSMLSVSDENLGYSANFEQDEQHRSFYDDETLGGRLDPYGTDASSDFSDDNDKCYGDDGESCNTRRRIDVSPFDSQMNLANFSLLCIQEENEEEEEEEKQEGNNETDKSTKDDFYGENANAYKRLFRENSDYSDEDFKVLEECIKTGVSKVIRRTDCSDVDERHLF